MSKIKTKQSNMHPASENILTSAPLTLVKDPLFQTGVLYVKKDEVLYIDTRDNRIEIRLISNSSQFLLKDINQLQFLD